MIKEWASEQKQVAMGLVATKTASRWVFTIVENNPTHCYWPLGLTDEVYCFRLADARFKMPIHRRSESAVFVWLTGKTISQERTVGPCDSHSSKTKNVGLAITDTIVNTQLYLHNTSHNQLQPILDKYLLCLGNLNYRINYRINDRKLSDHYRKLSLSSFVWDEIRY